MLQIQDMTPHPSQYIDTGPTCRCAILWCRTSHWNTQLPILMSRKTLPGNPSLTFHTHQQMLNSMMLLRWWSLGSLVESTVPTGSWTRNLWCANPLHYPLAHSCFLNSSLYQFYIILKHIHMYIVLENTYNLIYIYQQTSAALCMVTCIVGQLSFVYRANTC